MVTSNEKEGRDEHTCEHKSSTAGEQNGDHFAWHQDDQKEWHGETQTDETDDGSTTYADISKLKTKTMLVKNSGE